MALELAAAYLHRYRLPIPAYLEEMDRVGAALQHPSLQGEAATGLTTGHDPNLHAALRLSLERVQKESPEAAELFGYLGHLASGHPIPLDLLAPTRDPAREERALRAALARLAGHSLVAWPEEAPGPEVHPLLAELARLEADPGPEALQAWAERVAEAFAKRYEEEHPHVALSLNNLASVLWQMGEYEEARRLHEQALAIVRRVYGKEHPHVAASLNNLALVLEDLGEYEEARRLFEQALAIVRRVYGKEHPHVALSLNNLAEVLAALGEYEEARRLFEQALAIVRKTLPAGHPYIRTVEANLRRVLREADSG